MSMRSAPMQKPAIEEAIDIAIGAVNRGEFGVGKAALNWVIKQDPNNASAWLWMACCMTDDKDKQDCYRRVSSISDRR